MEFKEENHHTVEAFEYRMAWKGGRWVLVDGSYPQSQWFSTRGVPSGHLPTSGDILGFHNWERHWHLVVEARDAAKHSTLYRTAPKEFIWAKVSLSPAVEKPCSAIPSFSSQGFQGICEVLLIIGIGAFLFRIQKPNNPSWNSAQGLKTSLLVLWTSTLRTTNYKFNRSFCIKRSIMKHLEFFN